MKGFSEKEITILKNCFLLKDLPEQKFNDFIDLCSRVNFNKGDLLVKEKETNDNFYIIISGSVELYKNGKDDKEQYLIGSLSSGETIGEMRVIQNRTCSLTVKAAEPTIALCASIKKLISVENKPCYDSILDAILNILNDRLYHSNQTVLDKINEKKRKNKQFILALVGVGVLAIFLCELGLSLYFVLNSTDICNQLHSTYVFH